MTLVQCLVYSFVYQCKALMRSIHQYTGLRKKFCLSTKEFLEQFISAYGMCNNVEHIGLSRLTT